MKYGMVTPLPGAVKLRLRDYLAKNAFTSTPAVFGHYDIISEWGMLGNDTAGCCVFSGRGHETMLLNAERGISVDIETSDTLADYSYVTGYDPDATDPETGENPTDTGSDPVMAAEFCRTIGLEDAEGKRHRIASYAALTRGDAAELAYAVWQLQVAGIGIQVPAYARDQFARGAAWDISNGPADIEGGHYIPVVGRLANGNFLVVTWGKLQEMTPAFYEKWGMFALVYFSDEMFDENGKDIDGLDRALLIQHFNALAEAEAA